MKSNPNHPHFDVLLGSSEASPQYGLIGQHDREIVAIDLNAPNTIGLFGVQGSGKSYTLGAIAEMASMPIDNINALEKPLATVFFHYSSTSTQEPEFCSMAQANDNKSQLERLKDVYGADPQPFEDVVLLTPKDSLEERQREYPSINVQPLTFASRELSASNWKFLMGAVGNQAMYIRQITQIMRSLRNNITIDLLEEAINQSDLPEKSVELALMRLGFAREYIDDSTELKSLIKPGRLIIVDIRDELIEKDEALGLFVVLLNIFATAKDAAEAFNKLVIFDECHKYTSNPDMVISLVEMVREMRHKGTSIVIASQDPPSVPVQLIELSTLIFLHKFNTPTWLTHLKKAKTAFASLSSKDLDMLLPGQAYVWTNKATDKDYVFAPTKIECRPRVTKHGGDSLLAHRES